MLRFSKKADYGLMAVHYIAFHQHDGVVNAKRIAEDLGIPGELLAKILQRLAKGKLIASVNGPKGGYVLARERRPDPGHRGAAGDRGTARPGGLLPDDAVRAARALQHPAPGPGDPDRHRAVLETMTLESMNTLNEPPAVVPGLVAMRH